MRLPVLVRTSLCAATALLAGTGLVLGAGTATASSGVATTVRSVSNGACLDVPGGSHSVNVVLQTLSCTAAAQQAFHFTPVSGPGSTYRIRDDASGLCASDYRDQIRQSSCAGDPVVPAYGKWTLRVVDDARHTYRIEDTQTLGTATPLCMTFTGNGGDVNLAACTTRTTQVARLMGSV